MTCLPDRPIGRLATSLALSSVPFLAGGLALVASAAGAQVTADYVTFHGANGDCAVDQAGFLYVFGIIQAVGPVYEPLVPFPGAPWAAGIQPDNITRWLAKLDPISGEVVWSRFLRGIRATGVEVAADGQSVYVVGWGQSELSAEFPPTSSPYRYNAPGRDGFVGRYDATTGCPLAYSSYAVGVDGGNPDPYSVTVDPLGNVHIVGRCSSPTADADMVLEGYYPGGQDWHAFAVGFDPTLEHRQYFTYLPLGSDPDAAQDVVADGTSVYVAGYTESSDIPNVTHRVGTGGGRDAYVLKFRPHASTVDYLTVIGGPGDEAAEGNAGLDGWQEGAWLDVDDQGHVTVATWTTSSWSASASVPAPNRFGPGGNDDVLVTRLDGDGANAAYLTLIGGVRDDVVEGLARNVATGRVYVAGGTKSNDFPTPNGLVTSHSSSPNKFDGYVVELDDTTGELLAGTFLGSSSIDDVAGGVEVGPDGSVFVTGRRGSGFEPSPVDTPPSSTTYELLHYAAKLRFGAPPPPAPGITVAPTSGLVTTEAGGTDSFSVVLDTAPAADVTLEITSDTPAEGLVSIGGSAPAASVSLVFTPADWDSERTVIVHGQQDTGEIDGDVAYLLVTSPAVSTDAAYASLDTVDVGAVNEDDDSPQPVEVEITGLSHLILQAGGEITGFTVTGTGFAQGAVITFVGGVGPAPTAGSATLDLLGNLTATVSVGNQGPKGERRWTVRVTNEDQSFDDYEEEDFVVIK